MGNLLPTFHSGGNASRKRKIWEHDSKMESDEDLYYEMNTPKRRKIMSTSKYIYKTLFEEGQNSDVTIVALHKEWKLHKVYLCQSPYFCSMFNGAWVESSEGIIFMGIEDTNITVEALCKVFGSLYQDEITIDPTEAVAILAAATLLQLDDLIHQSAEVMAESINLNTALIFYEAAQRYGLIKITNLALDWFYKNMSTKIQESPCHLRKISCELMTELILSPQLIVIQTEFSLYLLLKMWLFLKNNFLWEGNSKDCSVAAHNYFHNLSGDTFYLLTEVGSTYLPIFRALRLQHLVSHHVDMEVLEMDRIIPFEWFMPVFKLQWYTMLRVDQGVDRGPKLLTEEEFENQCLRCGRVLQSEAQHTWRWTGFNFGFDLVVSYGARLIKFRRNLRSENDHRAAQQLPRHLMYRLNVFAQDKNGNVTHTAGTKLQTLSLTKNEQVTVLKLEADMPFPLLLSANFLVTTPLRPTDTARPCTDYTVSLPIPIE